MYRPNRWKSWNFGFSDITEVPSSEVNISSDSIPVDYDVDDAPPYQDVRTLQFSKQKAGGGIAPGLDKQQRSKGSGTPPVSDKHKSTGFLSKVRGFLKRIKKGGEKRSKLKGSENWELRDVNDSAKVADQQYLQYPDNTKKGRHRSYPYSKTENESDNTKKGRPRSYPFLKTENVHGSFGHGSDIYQRTISSGIHTDYGSIGGYAVKRTQSVIISDAISRVFIEPGAGAASFDYYEDTNSIESQADTPSLDYSQDSEESDMSGLMIHSRLDVLCEQGFRGDYKGFPFNVVRLLAIQFKVEERFVVPTTSPLGKLTFIIYDKEQGKDKKATVFDQTVLFRNPKSIKSEGLKITNYCREMDHKLKPPQRATLKRIIQHHADELFTKHSNINFIGTSPVKSWRNGDYVRNEACIVICCSSKGYIPFGEEKFPTELAVGEVTVLTDIREGYFQFGPHAYTTSRSSDTHDKLKMGCQFGIEGGSSSGTIGPFVNFNGNMAFLTCAHIINGIDENGYAYDDPAGNIKIEQPSSTNFGSTGNRCGSVKRAVFKPKLSSSVDAAVVEITEQCRRPVSGQFAVDSPIRMQQAGFDDLPYYNSGKIHMNPNTIDSDKRMVKFGSETHVTRGTLISEGTVVTPVSTEMGLFGNHSRKVLMRNQMEISGLTSHGAFFQPGDSGSGVFFVDRTGMGQELTCIGMAIGSTSNGTAIVSPILDILDALQLPRSLWQFP